MAKIFLKINIVLLAFVVGAVHSIHDPAYTGIKTKTYRRDPQIAQALHYQQQQQNQQHNQQQQQQHFTANHYQHANNQRPIKTINSENTERLSAANDNYNNAQQQPNQQHYHREQPIYERNFHERHAAIAPTPLRSNSNWDDAENVITDDYAGCPAQFTGQLPYAYDCRRFLNCWNGRGHIQTCSPGTVFNPDTLECDRPDKVVCGAVGSARTAQSRPTNANYRAGRLLDAKVEHVPQLCPTGVTGLRPHPTDCTKFLNCANGNVHVQDCGPGTAYSIPIMVCDFIHKVDCSGREAGEIDAAAERRTTYVNNQLSSGSKDVSHTAYGSEVMDMLGGESSSNTDVLDDTNTSDGIFCPTGVSGHFPYPFDYSKFMHCNHGNTAIQNCVPGTMFSISKRVCDERDDIDPHDHVSITIRDKNFEYSRTVASCPPGMHGDHLYPYDCTKYVSCMQDQQIAILSCAPGMVYSHSRSKCLPKLQVQAQDRVDYASELRRDMNSPTASAAHGTSPYGANTIVVSCPASGTGLYPYPFDCGKYLRCQNGQIIVELCAPGSVFSLSTKRCDLKEHVDASERVAFSQNSDYPDRKSSKKNENFAENLVCPPGMDGLFLHPFDCSAYLRCSHGTRSIEYCPSGTIFSITRQQCIARDQVKTFDRVDYFEEVYNPPSVIPHWQQRPTSDRNDYARGQDLAFKESDNVICPPGSSGVFPHPLDCNKFLDCVGGVTHIQSCEPGKAWDTAMELCTPKDQVECSTRSANSKLGSPADFSISNALQPPYYGETIACMPGLTGLFAHPFDCTKYLNCRNGRTIIQNCIAGSVFSITKKYCELKEQVQTNDRVPFVHEYGHELMDEMEAGDFQQTVTNANDISCPAGATGMHLHPFDFNKYLKCDGGRTVIYACPPGLVFGLASKQCIAQNESDAGFVPALESNPEWVDFDSPTQISSNQSLRVQCPAGATGMFPHPNDCTKFLSCANGITYIQDCAPGTAWSRDLETCDFEDKVDCARGQTLQSGDSVRTGDIPNARVQCSESSSGLQPHPYDCTIFLNCANGIAHIQDCSPGTAWNKAMQVCDYIANVNCAPQNNRSTPSVSHRPTNTGITNNNRGSKNYQPNPWNIPATDSTSRTYQPRPPSAHATPGRDNGYQPRPPPGQPQPGFGDLNQNPHTYRPTPPTAHEQPQHFNGYGRGPHGVGSTTSRTDLYNPQPSYNDRWTGMQRPRPSTPGSHVAQPNYYPGTDDNGQQPVNTNWGNEDTPNRRHNGNIPSTWSGTDSSVHPQSPGYTEDSVQPNRNYAPNVRKYSTPLAQFAPITSTTPIPSTNIYYAQPVGSQEDSREVFDNISGGDLSPPKKPPTPTYINSGRPNIWTPTVHSPTSGHPGYDSLPIPNQNLMPPQSTTFQSNSQQQPISPHTNSSSPVPQTINVPVTRLFPPFSTDSRQFPVTEPRTFNDTFIVLDNLPGTIWPLKTSPISTPSSWRTPNTVDESNLYGGLQPPISTPTQASGTPTTYLSPPTYPTPPVHSNPQPDAQETQARVYQIYPPVRNATVQSFSRDPHYSRSYSGVAHSRNTSWPNLGIKSPQPHPSVDDYATNPQTNPESNRDSSGAPTPSNYNRHYYNPSQLTQHNDETDPNDSMQQLPISDALRMLLRPYFNRSGTVADNEAALAESHIMNLAASASIPSTSTNTDTITTSTTIRPRSHIGEHEDDVELIFTGEQHSLVAVPTKNATTTTSSSSHANPRYPLNHAKDEHSPPSERNMNWHSHEYHQRHPHLPTPFIPDERSSSVPPQNTNWPHHRHHHHQTHNKNFHMSHPHMPNPFETTTSKTSEQETKTIARNTEATTPRSDHVDIDIRLDTGDEGCAFDCGNGKCVKDFEVCDGVNNCGNRRDEAQCEHLGYEVRLRGGESTNMGRVEVKIFGKWGYICDDKFGLLDADVVCKELGFKLGASEVRGNSFYPPAETNFSFVMDEVECSGNETALRQCVFKGWGVNNCGPDEVLGVVCKVPQLKCPNNYWLCSTSKECIPPAFVCDNTPDCKDLSDESERVCNSPIEYRLEGGRSTNVGRVEVMYRGEWGTVCDDDFGLNEAQVLCNSLGFFGAAKIEKNIFGPGSGPIWLDQVSCFGNETSIDKCNHWTWGEHNCNHTEDVGLRCTAGPAPRRTTLKSGTKGSVTSDETSRSIEDSSSTLEDIGLYGNQVQRSSKFLNANSHKRCGQFKQNLVDEYEHPEERVVNGTMAKRGQHPWQATIRTKGRGGISSHWCGAVLISKKHLLTAAHCLVGYPKGAYFIRMGDHYANIAEASEIDSYIENWYIHEKFRDQTHMNNDIALIVLKNPVRFNDYIQPICLPDKDAPLQVNRMCTISGWGSIKSGVSTPSNILRAAQLPILSDETCKQAHVYGTSMTERMFCAGSMDESVDACDGDSGGPLVCSDEDGETLYGIISWGQQCGFANKPGVYVRIEKYIDWIYERINFSMQQTSN